MGIGEGGRFLQASVVKLVCFSNNGVVWIEFVVILLVTSKVLVFTEKQNSMNNGVATKVNTVRDVDVVVIVVDTSETHVVIDVRGRAPDKVSFATLQNWTPVLQFAKLQFCKTAVLQ